MRLYLLLLVEATAQVLHRGKEELSLLSSLDNILDFFRNDSSPLAQDILHVFQTDCCVLQEQELPQRRKPFIVVEGNYRQSRNTVGLKLARIMKGRYLVHPAYCLQRFASTLPKGTRLRRAFYYLSVYAISYNAKHILSLGSAVVVNGYWWDMAIYSLVQSSAPDTIPDIMTTLRLPEELIKPDLVFYLNLPDDLYYVQATTRNPHSWKPR